MESMRVKPVGTGNLDKLEFVPDDPLRSGTLQPSSMKTHRILRIVMTPGMTISQIVVLSVFSSGQCSRRQRVANKSSTHAKPLVDISVKTGVCG